MLLLSLMTLAFGQQPNIVIDFVDGTDQTTLTEIATVDHIQNLTWVDSTTADNGLAEGISNDIAHDIAILESDPRVEAVNENYQRHTLGVNDPDYAKQWHMKAMDSDWVWKNTKAGQGVVVAILDTGLTVTEDFNPKSVSPLGKSFIDGENLTDLNGHGTHCAGTVAEWTNNGFAGVGLANQATILPVKVLSNSGSGYDSGIAAGIYYAVENGANVISMSLGSGSPSKTINKAIDKAISAGVIVVAAAGNDGCENCVGFPGGYDPVIGVGATGPNNERAPYSSYGKGLDIYAPGGNKKVPGGGVWQYTAPGGKPGLYEFQGTSMATPHVAAAAAVLLGEGMAHSQTDFQNLLCSTAHKSEFPDKYSCGRVNLEAAVKALKNSNDGIASISDAVLPSPSPAGYLTLLITLAGLFITSRLTRSSSVSTNAATGILGASILTSGPLYLLTNLPFHLPLLGIFMVNWLEWPEYIIGPGWSGNPLWLSFLPMVIPMLIGMPFKFIRRIVAGMSISAFIYLILNAAFSFNTVWFMPPFGATLFNTGNALVYLGMAYMATEYERIRGETL